MTRTQQLIALVALSFAGSAAMADDITVARETLLAPKTRSQVKVEVLRAQAAGTLRIGEGEAAAPQAALSVVTRDQVRAGLRAPKARVLYPEAV
jgi:hypothetical protein